MNIRISHELDLSEDEFFHHFFDQGTTGRLFREHMGFPEFEIREQHQDDRQIRRTIAAVPKMDVPGPVAKLLGSNFRYVETGTFDKKTKVWSWETTPSMLADKTKSHGTMRVEVLGPKKIRRVVDITVEAKVFGIGGMIESTFEKNIRDGWEKATQFFSALASA